MRIEDTTAEALAKAPKEKLYELRLRFIQLYGKNFEDKNVQIAGLLKRSDLLEGYRLLLKELHGRGLKVSRETALDRSVFRKAMFGLDIGSLCEKIIIEDYVAINGPFVDSPVDAGGVNIVIKEQTDKIESILKEALSDEVGKEISFDSELEHLEKTEIPLYDLVLRPKESLRRINISKPEVTEQYVRIPIGSGCEVTATIDISEEKGIKALYCGKEKRVRTYLFDKEKWTMAEAKKWIAEQAFKKPTKKEMFNCECLECGHTLETEEHCKDIKCPECNGKMRRKERPGPGQKTKKEDMEYFFKFYKQVKSKQMVGGIVYEPNAVDTQGDYTDAEEIQKAMYAFMEKYAKNSKRIKIGHKGATHTFPIMECFQPEHDIQRGGQTVKKGAWWLMLKVTDKGIWAEIEAGKINGFSMGGTATGVNKDLWECEKNWNKLNPEKAKASHLLEYAVRTGKLKKPKYCSKCKKEASLQFHHDDYKDALKGVWLCASCHKKLHLSQKK